MYYSIHSHLPLFSPAPLQFSAFCCVVCVVALDLLVVMRGAEAKARERTVLRQQNPRQRMLIPRHARKEHATLIKSATNIADTILDTCSICCFEFRLVSPSSLTGPGTSPSKLSIGRERFSPSMRVNTLVAILTLGAAANNSAGRGIVGSRFLFLMSCRARLRRDTSRCSSLMRSIFATCFRFCTDRIGDGSVGACWLPHWLAG